MTDEMRWSVFCDSCDARVAWASMPEYARDAARLAGWQLTTDGPVWSVKRNDYCPACQQKERDE